jgi:hypothetical protein
MLNSFRHNGVHMMGEEDSAIGPWLIAISSSIAAIAIVCACAYAIYRIMNRRRSNSCCLSGSLGNKVYPMGAKQKEEEEEEDIEQETSVA